MNPATVKFKVVERVVVRKKKKNSNHTTKTVSDHTIRSIDVHPTPNRKPPTPLSENRAAISHVVSYEQRNDDTQNKLNTNGRVPKRGHDTDAPHPINIEKSRSLTPETSKSLQRSLPRPNGNRPLYESPKSRKTKLRKQSIYSSDQDSDEIYSQKRNFASKKSEYSYSPSEIQKVGSIRTSQTGDKTVPKISETQPLGFDDPEALFSDISASTTLHSTDSSVLNSSETTKIKPLSDNITTDDEHNGLESKEYSPIKRSQSYQSIKRSPKSAKSPTTHVGSLEATHTKTKDDDFSTFYIPICSATVIIGSNTKYNQYFNFDSEIPKEVYEYYFPEMSIIKLGFPASDYFERFSLLVPEQFVCNATFVNEYNPINELISTVSTFGHLVDKDSDVKEEILDPTTGIIRLLEKARNKKDGVGFLTTICKLNNIFKRKKVKFSNYRSSEMSFEIVSNIFSQIYNRCITNHVEKLGKYRAFSNNVYGEINPVLVDDFIKKCKLRPKDIFVDLGCGIGNVVIQTAMQAGCASYGIEIMDVPAYLGQAQAKEYKARMKVYGLKRGIVEVTHGDFLEDKHILEVLKSSTVILVNNHAFDSKLNHRLMQMFLDLKEGTKIISLKSFGLLDFKINARNAGSLESILKVKKHSYWSDCVSWTSNPGTYYIQTIDRKPLQQFYSM